MQQISLILLLLIGLSRAHESHSSDQQILEVVRTETADDHEGNNNIHKGDAESSNESDAILNALMAFGINDTDLRPGQILCPPSNLGSSYKGNRIVVGAVGCRLDPLDLSLHWRTEKRIEKAS